MRAPYLLDYRKLDFTDARIFYFIDGGNGTFATVSLFANRSDGESFNQVGMDWVQKNLGSLLPSKPKVTSGEVRIHATAAALVP